MPDNLSCGIELAVRSLVTYRRLHRAGNWPEGADESNPAGLYAWYTDKTGADDLSKGIGAPMSEGLIYAGQTGATLWPSGKRSNSTLSGRIGKNHIRGRMKRSTLRRTLAA
jgi:hypothetical protein